MKKNAKVDFSEKIDSAINGYALGFSFLAVAIFLFVSKDYFESRIATYIISAAFGLVGVSGLATEVDNHKKIKGVLDIALGSTCLIIWYVLYHFFGNALLVKIGIFIILVIGAYGTTEGVLKILYSTYCLIRNNKGKDKSELIKGVILFISQLLGLVLTTCNILKIFKIL